MALASDCCLEAMPQGLAAGVQDGDSLGSPHDPGDGRGAADPLDETRPHPVRDRRRHGPGSRSYGAVRRGDPDGMMNTGERGVEAARAYNLGPALTQKHPREKDELWISKQS
jgi:hypothetical protein